MKMRKLQLYINMEESHKYTEQKKSQKYQYLQYNIRYRKLKIGKANNYSA